MRPFDLRIQLLNYLGDLFRDISSATPVKYLKEFRELENQLDNISEINPWFTKEFILLSISTWGETLTPEAIYEWQLKYKIPDEHGKSRSVVVIMAGNIPLVGFHDFICTILSGNKFIGKLSSRDNILFPLIREWIMNFDPEWKNYIQLTQNIPDNPQILIATGSNNTSRLIKQQYSTNNKIVRHNRSSVGLLSGSETKLDLQNLSKDILSYYGLGCRNLSLLLLPENYPINHLIDSMKEAVINLPTPYINNLKYLRAKARVNKTEILDAGKILFDQNPDLNSPLGMVNYSYYKNPGEVEEFRITFANQIQCVVGHPSFWKDVLPFGQSQKPGLDDYADGRDTMDFLITLT